MSLTRPAVRSLIPALVTAGAAFPAFAEPDDFLPSASFASETLPLQESEPVPRRRILKGKVTKGEHIEAHETTLPPNALPHPPGHHVHAQMWRIREGTVEFTIDGALHRPGPGGGFVRLNEEHAIKNVGLGLATYFVIPTGSGADA